MLKKIQLFFLGTIMLGSSYAQIKVGTTSFDLESIKKEKYKIYGGAKQPDGSFRLQLGTANCNGSRDNFGNWSTFTFSGVEWDFTELYFNKDFSYQKSEDKHFGTSVEASQYAPIWGKKFRPIYDGFGYVIGNPSFDASYMGKEAVLVSLNLNKAIVNKAMIYGKVTGVVGKGSNYGCSELPNATLITKINPKEEKGQKWYPVSGFHGIGSGAGFFMVSGTGFPENKLNYVLNKYNSNLDVEKSITLSTEYSNSVQIFELKKENTAMEYVVVFQGSKKYAPKGLAIKEPDFVEVVVIDATSLEIKWKQESKLAFSKWFIQYVSYTAENGIMLAGPCGDNTKDYLGAPGGLQITDGANSMILGNCHSTFPNFQLMLLKDNKIEKITGVSSDVAASKLLVLAGNTSKVKSTPVFTKAISDAQSAATDYTIESKEPIIKFIDSKIILSFVTHIDGSSFDPKRNGIANLVFSSSGDFLKYILYPTEGFTAYDLFTNNQKKLYLVNYDLNDLNKKVLETGTYEPKSIKNTIAATLEVAMIDLENLTGSTIQTFGKEEYGINVKNPIVADTEEEIILLGRSLNKKAKDSELMLIRISK